MRVLHFFKTYWPDSFGGVERTIHAIAKGTSSYGVEAQVLSLSRQPQETSVQVDGHWAYKARLDLELASTGFSLSALRRFRELGNDADIIHYHFPWPFMDVVHFATRLQKPTIVTYHSDIVKQKYLLRLYQPLMHRFLTSVDQIVVTSPNYLASSDQLRGFEAKSTVIPIGLDRASYPQINEARKNRMAFPATRKIFPLCRSASLLQGRPYPSRSRKAHEPPCGYSWLRAIGARPENTSRATQIAKRPFSWVVAG